MASQGREEMFWKIMVFFAVVTAITAIFNLATSEVLTIHNFGDNGVLTGQVVPNFNLPNLPGNSNNSLFTEQDYTYASGYNLNTTIIAGGGISLGPLWTQADGIGMTLTNLPIFPPPPFSSSYLMIKGAIPTNNNYTVTYTMGSQGIDFNTIVYRTNPEDHGVFIKFDSTGAHLRNEIFNIEDIYYQGANNAHTIKTEFNTLQKSVDLWIDGNYIDRFYQLPGLAAQYQPYPDTFYAGVFSDQYNVVVEKIETKIQQQAVSDDPGLVGSILYSLGLREMANMLKSLISIFGAMLGLTSNPAVPFWLWAIVALPCVGTLYFMYIEIARGV